MTGHTPWPPGKLHDDMQRGRKEVFRLGDWSIFAAGTLDSTSSWTAAAGITNANWDSFIMHSASWAQWEDIPNTINVNTWIKGETVPDTSTPTPQQKRVTKHCNTNMIPHDTKICPGCGRPIPKEIAGLWALQNMERIQELNSG